MKGLLDILVPKSTNPGVYGVAVPKITCDYFGKEKGDVKPPNPTHQRREQKKYQNINFSLKQYFTFKNLNESNYEKHFLKVQNKLKL